MVNFYSNKKAAIPNRRRLLLFLTGQGVLIPLAVHSLAQHFAVAADGFGFAAGAALGGLFEIAAQLHFPENAFPLQLFLQRAQGLIDIVVTNQNFHGSHTFLKAIGNT